MEIDPYKVLGVHENTPFEKIKSAFRALAKKHHPDTGGDETKILKINQAWGIIKKKKSAEEPIKKYSKSSSNKEGNNKEVSSKFYSENSELKNRDNDISNWIKIVYNPIDRLLGEIINPLPQQIKELSGDPYDDNLMGLFCSYLERSQRKIDRIQTIYQSIPCPISARNFSLNLYQCFSEVKDALNEFNIYTAGYVDNYLHDGQEMIRIAKRKRLELKKEKNNLPIS